MAGRDCGAGRGDSGQRRLRKVRGSRNRRVQARKRRTRSHVRRRHAGVAVFVSANHAVAGRGSCQPSSRGYAVHTKRRRRRRCQQTESVAPKRRRQKRVARRALRPGADGAAGGAGGDGRVWSARWNHGFAKRTQGVLHGGRRNRGRRFREFEYRFPRRSGVEPRGSARTHEKHAAFGGHGAVDRPAVVVRVVGVVGNRSSAKRRRRRVHGNSGRAIRG